MIFVITELDDENIYRNPLYLMIKKTMVSYRFSLTTKSIFVTVPAVQTLLLMCLPGEEARMILVQLFEKLTWTRHQK